MMTLLVDVTPTLGPAYTLLAFVIVIVGGLGSMPGALARRRADRRIRGARGALHHAVGQEHGQFRAADPRPAASAARPARKEPVNRRATLLLAALADRCCLALPAFAQSLSAFGGDADPLFRLHRPSVERDDGLCRPAFARSLALRRPWRLRRRGALRALRRRTVGGRVAGGGVVRAARGRHRRRWPFASDRRHLLRAADHRLCRVHAHRFRSLRRARRARAVCSSRSSSATPSTC